MQDKLNQDRAYGVSVLVVDDDEVWRSILEDQCKNLFKSFGDDLNVVAVETPEKGLEALSNSPFHIVLLDKELLNASGERVNGIDLIPEFLGLQPLTQLFMVTVDDDPRDVVTAMKAGAVGYLLKEGKQGHDKYREQQLAQAFSRARILRDRERLTRQTDNIPCDFVAKSPAMQRLNMQLEALAEVSRPVLYVGDTGLGKGAAAKRLHQLRAKFLKQNSRPFFNLNIANFSGDLAMSELFGHEGNSFTGSGSKTKVGYFELANGGDIFLDEIGEASLELQARLLKVIEEREFQRVGGSRTLKTAARVIFATNRDLKRLVQEGLFREDLYMRIATFVVELPKLNERKEDVPDIIRVFLSRINKERSGEPVLFEELPTDFIDYLCRDNVPGNIRGLENDLQRLIVFSPKDKNGRLNFQSWKTTLRINRTYAPSVGPSSSVLTLEQFLSLSTDFIRDGFEGVSAVKQVLERKLLVEAQLKFPTLTKRAQALNIPIANASRKYGQLKLTSKSGVSSKRNHG